MLKLLFLLIALVLPAAAAGVLIDSGDGTGNTTAPSPDPGWDHVGTVDGAFTAVHLEDHWVITADHVGAGEVVLGGVAYTPIAGSEVDIRNGDGSDAELMMFAITPAPPLPALTIVSSTPSNGAELVLVGNGKNRGLATSCDSNGPIPGGVVDGYDWAGGKTLRWGTNFVEVFDSVELRNQAGDVISTTESFGSIFDPAGSTHEAQGANGDSGGAAFAWNGSEWELAGVLFAIEVLPGCNDSNGQDPTSTFYTNVTYAADLSVYRDPILDAIAMPEPAGGALAGATLVAALARRRRARR